MNSLPASVNYAEVLPSLPENATRYSVALQPTNGSKFNASSQITFQYPNRGYLIPDSIYLRYRMSLTATASAISTTMFGTPFFTPFQRLETQFGSVTVDSINNYHQVCNMLTNCTMDWAQKYGNAVNYGYSTSVPVTTEELDSRAIAVTASTTSDTSFSGPLPCLLSNITDKLVPLFAMPTITQILTVDSLLNIFVNTTNFALFELSNLELCYDFIELGSDVDAMVRGMGDKIYIKSQSFSNSAVTIPKTSSSSQSYIFNQRYASIKGAILLFSGNNQTSQQGTYLGNNLFDSRDPTSGNGSIYMNIAGVNYPQKPLSTLNNKSAILMELKKVMGSIYDKTNNMSIGTSEFNYKDTDQTTAFAPGKFYCAFNLQKLHSNNLLTGISTNNSNISINIEQNTAVGDQNRQLNLILAYDALIEIDMVNKQSSVKV